MSYDDYIKLSFDEFLGIFGDMIPFYEDLNHWDRLILGKLIFKNAPEIIRAEALTECKEFDDISHLILEDNGYLDNYLQGVALWIADAHSDEFDEYFS